MSTLTEKHPVETSVDKSLKSLHIPTEDVNFMVVPMGAVLAIIGDLCPECMATVRKNIVANMRVLRQDSDPQLKEIVVNVSRETGVNINEIMGNSVHKEIVSARRKIADRARRLGYSFPRIGALINKHHTTVINLLSSKKRHA